ncbi:MAG: DUF3800 domain-containing protein [Blastocatellia bacterium]|nr:DUF3800 domain-containing protein [Blastocatellia bacterium]
MTHPKVTHVGFADESNWNKGRFRSIGLVTAPLEYITPLNDKLKELLRSSNLKEFKWANLDRTRTKECCAAQKLCRFAIEKALQQLLRVDILIWDIEDSRHKLIGRDNIANLQRMYYHLFRNVLRLRWPDYAVWRLHPDEHTALNWKTVQDYLELVSTRVEPDPSLFPDDISQMRLLTEFSVKEILSVVSSEHPLLQLADLFAGLAVFSWEKSSEYKRWLSSSSKQILLLNEQTEPMELSQRTEARFRVLRQFDELCKQRKLSVSLQSSKGLRTFNPEKPINFWMYEPQHPEDKAPVRK